MVVRSVDDMEGIKAWQRLHRKYNPRTMARGVRMLTEVIGPPKIKELSNFETSVTTWEEKVKRLTAQFDEKLSDNMKIAIFTNMMPGSLQDYIYIHTEKDCKYEDVREKVGALVSNKVAANTGPTPMDVGDVGEIPKGGEGHRHGQGEGKGHEGRELELQGQGQRQEPLVRVPAAVLEGQGLAGRVLELRKGGTQGERMHGHGHERRGGQHGGGDRD